MLTVVFLLVVLLRGERSSTDADGVNRLAISPYGEDAVQEVAPKANLKLFLVETDLEHDPEHECRKMAPTPEIFKPFGTQFAYCPCPEQLLFMDNTGQVISRKQLVRKDSSHLGLTPLEFEAAGDVQCPDVVHENWFHKLLWIHAGEVPAAPLGGIIYKEKENAGVLVCRLYKWRLPPHDEYIKVAAMPEKDLKFYLDDTGESTRTCDEIGPVGPSPPIYELYGPNFAFCASPPMFVFSDDAGNVTRQKRIVLANHGRGNNQKYMWKEEKLRLTRVPDVTCQDVMIPSYSFGMTNVERCIWVHKNVEKTTPDGGLQCKMKGEDKCRLYNLRDLKMWLFEMDARLTDTCTESAPTPEAFRHLGVEFFFCHPQVFVFKDSAGQVTAKKSIKFEKESDSSSHNGNDRTPIYFRMITRGITCPAELLNTSHRYFWIHAGAMEDAPEGAFMFRAFNKTTCELYKSLLPRTETDMFPLPEIDIDFILTDTTEEPSGTCQPVGQTPHALHALGAKLTFCTPRMFVFMDEAEQVVRRTKIVENSMEDPVAELQMTRVPGDVPCEPKMLDVTFAKTDVKETLWIHKDTAKWAPGGGLLFKMHGMKKCRLYKLIDERVFMSESVKEQVGYCDEGGPVPPEFSDLGDNFSFCLGPTPSAEEEPKPMFRFTDSGGQKVFKLKFSRKNPGNDARSVYFRTVDTNYKCPAVLLNASRYGRMWIHSGIENAAPDGGFVWRPQTRFWKVTEASCHLQKLVTFMGDEMTIYLDDVDESTASTKYQPPKCTSYGPSPPAFQAFGPQFAFCVAWPIARSGAKTGFYDMKYFAFKSEKGEVIARKLMTLHNPCACPKIKEFLLMKTDGEFPCQEDMFQMGLAKADLDAIGLVHKGAYKGVPNGGMMFNIRQEDQCRIYVFHSREKKRSINASFIPGSVKTKDSASFRTPVSLSILCALSYFAVAHHV